MDAGRLSCGPTPRTLGGFNECGPEMEGVLRKMDMDRMEMWKNPTLFGDFEDEQNESLKYYFSIIFEFYFLFMNKVQVRIWWNCV